MRTNDGINDILQKVKNAKKESKYIDFKEKFDIDSQRDWCEIIKDIVAMANSGGGIILIGVKNDGMSSEIDIKKILKIDPAKITDKIVKDKINNLWLGIKIARLAKTREIIAKIIVQ